MPEAFKMRFEPDSEDGVIDSISTVSFWCPSSSGLTSASSCPTYRPSSWTCSASLPVSSSRFPSSDPCRPSCPTCYPSCLPCLSCLRSSSYPGLSSFRPSLCAFPPCVPACPSSFPSSCLHLALAFLPSSASPFAPGPEGEQQEPLIIKSL